MSNWDKKFIGLCNHIATWSKDPSTKVGAVIVGENNKILSTGYNGIPVGVKDTIERMSIRPEKYKWMEHAERNAIYTAASEGVSLKNSTIYCNFLPCTDCARAIIQSGIKQVIYETENLNSNSPEWEKSKQISKTMFSEANVKLTQYND